MDEEEEDNILVGVFLGTYSISKLPVGFLDYNFDTINDSANDGYSEELKKDSKRMKSFRESIAIFALAKTVAFVLELQAVKASGGVGMPYTKYKEEARKIVRKYNKTWLPVESDTANLQAVGASRTRGFIADKNVKYLEYVSRRDDRVRPRHRLYDGVVLPKMHPWFTTHTPPLSFSCRCVLRPTSVSQITTNKELSDIFRFARDEGYNDDKIVSHATWYNGFIFRPYKNHSYYRHFYQNKDKIGFSNADYQRLYKTVHDYPYKYWNTVFFNS